MTHRIFLVSIFLLFSFSALSQVEEKPKSSKFIRLVDSLFIDHDLSKYSLRVFSNYKVKQFLLANDDHELVYIPNNMFGVGVGVANSKLVVDIAINLKNKRKENTKRFDAQGAIVVMEHHYLKGYFQAYKGFNIHNDFYEPKEFRKDIKSWTIGLNYLYTFSEIEFSYSLLKAGLSKQDKKFHFTGGLGGFVVFDYFSADGSILPENGLEYFNEHADIKRYNGKGIGILAGLLAAFKINEDFTLIGNIIPGIGLTHQKVTLQDESYKPSDPMLYKVDLSVALNYNLDRYYINLTYDTGVYTTNLDFDNRNFFNLSIAKLAIGYKLKI